MNILGQLGITLSVTPPVGLLLHLVATVKSHASQRSPERLRRPTDARSTASRNENCAHHHRIRLPQIRPTSCSKRRHDDLWHSVALRLSQDPYTARSIFYHNPSTTFDHILDLHGIYHVGRGRTKTHRSTRRPSGPNAHTRGTSLHHRIRAPLPPSFIHVQNLERHEAARHEAAQAASHFVHADPDTLRHMNMRSRIRYQQR